MGKTFWMRGAACCAGMAAAGAAGAGLNELETRWLQLAWPVVAYARAEKLPLDIVVQPQPAPGEAPLAMAYVEGRCKLVLSMRGNPEAQSSLDAIPEALRTPVVEAMAAHELGHCWRYVQGAWHTLPAGDTSPRSASAHADPELASQVQAMQQSRHEEAYADLVGLAWTQRQHPQRYAEVHAWITHFRDDGEPAGNHHDTLAWLRLAAQPSAFDGGGGTPFEQAWPLWRRGLSTEVALAPASGR